MATWTPVEGLVPQETQDGGQAAGMVLKFYEPGTTTPLAMATDDTGGTTTTNFLLDSQGRTTNGGAIVVPHTSQSYKALLYLNQADADADATGSAVYSVDDINPSEPALGNPASDGYALVSTAAGVRSWSPAATADGVVTSGVLSGTTLQLTRSVGAVVEVEMAGLAGDGQPEWNLISALGSPFSVASTAPNSITALSDIRVAVLDTNGDTLSTYDYDVSAGTWSLIGSALTITNLGDNGICALNGTDVAVVDGGTNDNLQAYRFNGSTWSALGSPTSISMSSPGVSALSATSIILANDLDEKLTVYSFNGSVWSVEGNSLTISAFSSGAVCALSTTDFMMAETAADKLQVYTFDGSDIREKGNSLSVTYSGGICSLNGTDVLIANSASNTLQIYRFDGVNITPKGTAFSLSSTNAGVIAINGNHVAMVDTLNDVLQMYKLDFSMGTPFNQSLL